MSDNAVILRKNDQIEKLNEKKIQFLIQPISPPCTKECILFSTCPFQESSFSIGKCGAYTALVMQAIFELNEIVPDFQLKRPLIKALAELIAEEWVIKKDLGGNLTVKQKTLTGIILIHLQPAYDGLSKIRKQITDILKQLGSGRIDTDKIQEKIFEDGVREIEQEELNKRHQA